MSFDSWPKRPKRLANCFSGIPAVVGVVVIAMPGGSVVAVMVKMAATIAGLGPDRPADRQTDDGDNHRPQRSRRQRGKRPGDGDVELRKVVESFSSSLQNGERAKARFYFV